MNEPKHTPTLPTPDPLADDHPLMRVLDALDTGKWTPEALKAQQLLVAVPELLAACYAVLASPPMMRGAIDRTAEENATHETLWTAIRKATGEGE